MREGRQRKTGIVNLLKYLFSHASSSAVTNNISNLGVFSFHKNAFISVGALPPS